jgi:hypothetical protein
LALLLAGHAGTAAGAEGCRKNDRDCVVSEGDQGRGAIVTKGASFPGVEADGDLGQVAQRHKGCTDCEWKLVPLCVATGQAPDLVCVGSTATCAAPDAVRYRVYLRRGGGPWVVQGTVCLGPTQRPVSTADVAEAVRTEVVKYLPDAHPSFQPGAGGIVNLPTIFSAGEPATITTPPFEVLGFTVVVTAQARWEWTFDAGVVRDFAVPGGTYPDASVSHTYATAGARQVSVTTYWRGRFTIDGAGPFPVPEPEVSKNAGPLPVPVREARSELVGG